MFSSKSAEWETPQDLFDKLNKEFNFTLDPCATHENAKCKKYYTRKENGLSKSWKDENVFVNPPYGNEITDWVKKCADESKHAKIVLLIPSRTDTKYQHNYIFKYAKAVCFIKGRLKFENKLLPSWNKEGNFKISSAPFPSQIVVFTDEITPSQEELLNSLGKLIILK